MTKSAASFVIYVGLGAVAVAFTVIMLWLAAPIFSMPADRPAVGFKLSYHGGGGHDKEGRQDCRLGRRGGC